MTTSFCLLVSGLGVAQTGIQLGNQGSGPGISGDTGSGWNHTERGSRYGNRGDRAGSGLTPYGKSDRHRPGSGTGSGLKPSDPGGLDRNNNGLGSGWTPDSAGGNSYGSENYGSRCQRNAQGVLKCR